MTTTAIAVSTPRLRLGRNATTFLLVLPGLIFLLYGFVVPIGSFLAQSFDNRALRDQLQLTGETLAGWNGQNLPADETFAALAADLRRASERGTAALLGARLNQSLTGFRPLITRTATRIPETAPTGWREELVKIDRRWADIQYWHIIARESGPITWQYGLAALDLRMKFDGSFEAAPDHERIFVRLFIQTVIISAAVTALCVIFGLPVAYALAHGSDRLRGILMVFVLLPFWTSLLVRSAGWMVVLQDQGMLNYILSLLGLGEKVVSLMYSRAAVYIAMTHVLLPFMILPLYSVMKSIPPSYVRAALSLGASPVTAFRRVYLPQTVPGVLAGSLLVFVLAVGYYITPALVGGQSGQLISNVIAYHMQQSLNWGLAATLGSILLVGVLLVYWLFNRLTGGNGLRMG